MTLSSVIHDSYEEYKFVDLINQMEISVCAEGICSICMTESVDGMHCSVCTATKDKLVCKKCIQNMLRICSCNLSEVYYSCPHCRTKICEPKWVESCLDAQKRIVSLLRQSINKY